MADEIPTLGMTAPPGALKQSRVTTACGSEAGIGARGVIPRPQRWHQSDSLELGAYPGAVPSARLHARAILEEWQLSYLADDAGQIVSELVANAVEAHRRERLDAPIRLTLLAGLDAVLIVVCDASDLGVELARPNTQDESGRGLLIVNALTDWWGTQPFPGGGKTVRALLSGQDRRGQGCR